MAFFAVVKKSYSGAGRDSDETYVNVVTSVRTDSREFSTLITLEPWSDPTFPDFVVELTENQHDNFRDNLFIDGKPNLPRLQQRNTGSGSTPEFGSWTDPADDQSTWQAGLANAIPDPRWVLRMYDANPDAGGTHIGSASIDQSSGDTTFFVELINANGSRQNTNAADQKTEIGGVGFIFDFGSANDLALPAGITTFNVSSDVAGVARFPSNSAYRVEGPNEEQDFQVRVWGRFLPVG